MNHKSVERTEEPQSPAEITHYTQEEFLGKLYDGTFKWLTEDKKAEVIMEINPQEIDDLVIA